MSAANDLLVKGADENGPPAYGLPGDLLQPSFGNRFGGLFLDRLAGLITFMLGATATEDPMITFTNGNYTSQIVEGGDGGTGGAAVGLNLTSTNTGTGLPSAITLSGNLVFPPTQNGHATSFAVTNPLLAAARVTGTLTMSNATGPSVDPTISMNNGNYTTTIAQGGDASGGGAPDGYNVTALNASTGLPAAMTLTGNMLFPASVGGHVTSWQGQPFPAPPAMIVGRGQASGASLFVAVAGAADTWSCNGTSDSGACTFAVNVGTGVTFSAGTNAHICYIIVPM